MISDIYDVIRRRRDVRCQFTDEPLAPDVLDRILAAAHAAPSVGLSQPWDFIVIRDRGLRETFHRHVHAERDTFAATSTPRPPNDSPASRSTASWSPRCRSW